MVTQRAPWSIFRQPNGKIKAEAWAQAFAEKLLGHRPTGAQVQFVYDWEVAEGGGGQYNPLNIGRDPKHPGWSTGSQYGGGAAGYDTVQHGLQASVDYLHMPNFQAITRELSKNNIAGARQELIRSPWAASHYGGHLPTDKLPVAIESSGLIDPSKHKTGVTIGGVVGNIPKATGDVFHGIGEGAGKAASGAGEVVGQAGTGLLSGLWKSNPLVVIGLVVIVIVILKR